MKFTYYSEKIAKKKKVSVDGAVAESLHVTHWPGNKTPTAFKADTSTEIALNMISSREGEDLLKGYDLVTNNHWDTDGLLSAWTLVQPQAAYDHRDRLVMAAHAGDFNWFTSTEAVQFKILMEQAFPDPARSPIKNLLAGKDETEKGQVLYDQAFKLLPAALLDPSPYRPLWEKEFGMILESLERLDDGQASLTHDDQAQLSIFQSTQALHPMAMESRTHYDRVLAAVADNDKGGTFYNLFFTDFSWFDKVSPNRGERVEMDGLGDELQKKESGGEGRWVFQAPPGDLGSALRFEKNGQPAPSLLTVEEVVGTARRFLRLHSSSV